MRSRAIREGSVGLFVIVGIILFTGIAIWLKGFTFGDKSYTIIVEFKDASGVQVGAPVRYRGVEVGKITNIKTHSNGVDITIEISPANIKIPPNVSIEANRYGLIGEASIDIIPKEELTASAQSMNPLSSDCDSNLIVCNEDRLKGETGLELVEGMLRLIEFYTDSDFFNNINNAALNISKASGEIGNLTKELNKLSQTVQQEIKRTNTTAEKLTRTIDNTAVSIQNTSAQFSNTANQITNLTVRITSLLNENQVLIVQTLDSITNTSNELQGILITLKPSIEKINQGINIADIQQTVKNLETLTANAAVASQNFREISQTINDPQNIITLQQTLDSARATFENAQKITADLDELTGDPEFRSNVQRLVNGLSKLVSSSKILETQIQTAQSLEPLVTELNNQVEIVKVLGAATQQLQQQKPSVDPQRQRETNQALQTISQQLNQQAENIKQLDKEIQNLKIPKQAATPPQIVNLEKPVKP